MTLRNLGTNTAAFVAEGSAFADLAKQAGVDNTGTTECAAALQTALNSFAALGVRAYAKGTLKTASTLVIKGSADLGDATVNYTGTTGVAMQVGSTVSGAYTQAITVALPKIHATAKTTLGWTQVAGTVGVDLVSLYACRVHIPWVEGFETNLRVRGIGTGCVYNHFFLGHLDNGQTNQFWTTGTGGWTNQNIVYGGSNSHNSTEGTNVAGVRQIVLDSSVTFAITDNMWHGGSVEGNTAQWHAIIAGEGNEFNKVAWEVSGGARVKWDTGAFNNLIRGGKNADLIVETFTTTSASNDLVTINKTRRSGEGGFKGMFVYESTHGNTGVVDSLMATGARVAGTDPTTGYQVNRSASWTRMKAAADSWDRMRLDHPNGRFYLGDGTTDAAVYLGASGTTLSVTGATAILPSVNNTTDLGSLALKFKSGYFGSNLIINNSLNHSNASGFVGFYGISPISRPAAYTQTYATASRTHSAYTTNAQSSAYTGAADGEAKLADLNALRVAYENLRTSHDNTKQLLNSVLDDLQAFGLLQ